MGQHNFTNRLMAQWQADPPIRERIETDARQAGFYLRRFPSGAISYYARATVHGRRARPVKIGSAPAMRVKEARAAAQQILTAAANGVDAKAERDRLRAEPTVAELIEVYLASAKFGALAESTRKNDAARLRLHVLHRVGRLRVGALTVQRVRELRAAVEEDQRVGRRKHRIGGPGVAAKCVRTLSAVLTWGVEQGFVETNPIPGAIRLNGSGVRDAVMRGPEDYRALFETMDRLVLAYERGDRRHGLRPAVRDAFTLLAVTGLRKGEALGLRWRDVDFERDAVALISSKGARLRAGRSGGAPRPEIVAVPPTGMAALARRLDDETHILGADPGGDRLVFAGENDGRPLACDRDWRRVRDAAGLDPALTLHGLRHSLGTAAAIGGLDGLAIQRLLRHANPATTARYTHAAQLRERLADRAAALALGELADRGRRS